MYNFKKITMDVKKELTELKKYVTDTIKVYEKKVKELKKMQWEFDRDTDYIMMECMLNHQLFSTRMYLKMLIFPSRKTSGMKQL